MRQRSGGSGLCFSKSCLNVAEVLAVADVEEVAPAVVFSLVVPTGGAECRPGAPSAFGATRMGRRPQSLHHDVSAQVVVKTVVRILQLHWVAAPRHLPATVRAFLNNFFSLRRLQDGCCQDLCRASGGFGMPATRPHKRGSAFPRRREGAAARGAATLGQRPAQARRTDADRRATAGSRPGAMSAAQLHVARRPLSRRPPCGRKLEPSWTSPLFQHILAIHSDSRVVDVKSVLLGFVRWAQPI